MRQETRVLNVTSNLQGEKIGMSIDEGALAHIMGVLTDLYSDPEMAVLREYSTNAFDAHVEAGCPLPIQVTLPTTLSPYLKIRDYGNGLDAEDIRTIYSRYGTSTKRDSNDFVGTLGLGCKSALTYADQFTLQGIKNGVAVQVSVSRDADGAGSMTIVSEYETDEPSGVEVIIPAKARNDFAGKAKRLFQFWAEGTVSVNGEEPQRFEGLELAPNLYAVRDLGESVVVMGNVPYPFEHPYGFDVVAYVEIGDVQFTPSREALQMTSKTKAAVEKIIEQIGKGKEDAAQRLIDEATSKPEALKAYFFAKDLFGRLNDLTYNGEPIFVEFNTTTLAKAAAEAAGEEFKGYAPSYTVARFDRGGYYYSRRRSNGVEHGRVFPSEIVRTAVFLTGYTKVNLTPHFRKKLELWWQGVRDQYPGFDKAFLADELPETYTQWIDPAQIRDWEEVQNTKVKAEPRSDGRPAGSYEAIIDGKRQHVQADEIDPDAPIFYYIEKYAPTGLMKILNEHYQDAVYVELTTNRVAKFERLFPNAKLASQAMRELAEQWLKSLRKKDRLHIFVTTSGSRSSYNTLSGLDASRVDDPELREAIAIYKYKLPKKVAEQFKVFNSWVRISEDWKHPQDKYPLLDLYLDSYYGYRHDEAEVELALNHLYLYLNAAYAAESEAK